MTPLISIITINYNNAAGLEKTLRSIVNQSATGFEYIVIDGNSTDGSKNLLTQYAANITYSVSEPDRGIYHAMNKGIEQAKGKYLLFLNSGDELLNSQSVELAQSSLGGNEDLIYFDLLLRSVNGDLETRHYPEVLTFSHFLDNSLPHPATFIKSELFNRFGKYNESLKIVSDWVFFLVVVCKYHVSYKHIPDVFSVFNLDGISSDIGNRQRIEAEKQQAIHDEFPLFENIYHELTEAKQLKLALGSSRLVKLFKRLGFLKQL